MGILQMIPPVVWKWIFIIFGLSAIFGMYCSTIFNIISLISLIFGNTPEWVINNDTGDFVWAMILALVIIGVMRWYGVHERSILYPIATYGASMLITSSLALMTMIFIGFPINSVESVSFVKKLLAIVAAFMIWFVGRGLLSTSFFKNYYVAKQQ